MDNRQEFIDLYDIYEKLLTKKQQQYFSIYYFDDLSTGEIAANFNVSRNAVHDHIKKTCSLLLYYEQTLQIKMKNDLVMKALKKADVNELKEDIYKIIKG